MLIRGPSGSGKSTLAYSLIAAAEESGYFARLVGDDRVSISSHEERLIAHGHASILGKIERRSQGIIEVPFLAAAVLRLAIQLTGTDETAPRFPEPDHDHIVLAGAKLRCLSVRQDAAHAALSCAILADLRLRRIIF